jgi:hypothetical protein
MSASRLFGNWRVSSKAEGPGPDREEGDEAEKASADLKEKMNQLKARYRAERLWLEARSFEPDRK